MAGPGVHRGLPGDGEAGRAVGGDGWGGGRVRRLVHVNHIDGDCDGGGSPLAVDHPDLERVGRLHLVIERS